MIPYSLNPLEVDDYDDLYWLRKIRDANPTSQLPSLWLDSEDPYTQWEGVTWHIDKVIHLSLINLNINSLNKINKLSDLSTIQCYINNITSLDFSGCSRLTMVRISSNKLINLNISGCINLSWVDINSNQLTSLPSLTSKGNITTYDFTYNNFSTSELDRLRAMGFTDESKLLPQNP